MYFPYITVYLIMFAGAKLYFHSDQYFCQGSCLYLRHEEDDKIAQLFRSLYSDGDNGHVNELSIAFDIYIQGKN